MANRYLNNKAIQIFAEMMIQKIESVQDNWHKPWITTPIGLPRNAITGRAYNGINDLMLFFQTERKNYKIPAFLTFDQARKEGTYVKKGERAFTVIYWQPSFQSKKDPTKYIKLEEWKKLSEEEKDNYKKRMLLKEYSVFNVEQTNMKEDKPELQKKIESMYRVPKMNDENGMYKHAGLDSMLETKSWLCPIHEKESNRAFYRPLTDEITIPLKAQFKDGESYYGTLLHEMTHSTGIESRLNRGFGFVGNEKYAKEELIAEMTAALTGAAFGISTTIREENAQYLKSWLETLKAEPDFILTLLSDVHKASNMINEKIDLQLEEKEAVTKGKEEKIEDFAAVDVVRPVAEETKEINLFGLEKGKMYRFDADNKVIIFTGIAAGGYLNFRYADSGKTFQLITNGKPPKAIKSLEDYDIDIKPEDYGVKMVNGEQKSQTPFSLDEIPRDELKKINIKFAELSETDKNRLIRGKETKAIACKNHNGELVQASLQLVRNLDNSVSIRTNKVESAMVSRGIKV